MRGVREELIESSNLIAARDIYHFTYEEIRELFKNYSRENMRKGRGKRNSVNPTSRNSSRVKKYEIGNLLDNIKIDILNSLSMQLDVLQTNKKRR